MPLTIAASDQYHNSASCDLQIRTLVTRIDRATHIYVQPSVNKLCVTLSAEMKRWDRIKWVREFSSARVADGSDGAGTAVAKFARSARVKSEEYQQRYRSKCQQIFERQVWRPLHSLGFCLPISLPKDDEQGSELEIEGDVVCRWVP